MTERLLVVGAGPAGLSAAWHARAQGVEALLIDGAPLPGGAWAAMDPAMRCLSPRRLDRLPDGTTPEGLGTMASAAEVLAHLRSFAMRHGFRSRMGQRVTGLRRAGGDLELATSSGPLQTRAVIAATGTTSRPRPLRLSRRGAFDGAVLPALGLHARLEEVGERVLVVGAGNSGADAVHLLLGAGRDVVLASRGPLRSQPPNRSGLPGRLSWVLSGAPVGLLPPAMRCDPVLPVGDGLQRLVSAERIRLVGAAVCFEPGGVACRLGPGALSVPSRRVAVDTVVVAIGYEPALDWLDGLVTRDPTGTPLHRGGLVPAAPGLGLLGLECLRTRRSGFLRGMAADAGVVVRAVLRQTGGVR